MSKKYLSLEEAAAILGVKPDDLVRSRERGDIRGFADRGTWKFKSEDVEEFRRQRQPDSNPEVQLYSDDSSGESSVLGPDSDEVADQPTVIRGDSSGKVLDGASDSDVRLIVDDNLVGGPDSDPEVALPPLSDTDSDVRLVDDRTASRRKTEADSDSDVVLSSGDSDSDVKLVGSDSDSDVRLVGEDSSKMGDSDSDVALVDVEDTQPMKLSKGTSGSSVLADDSSVRGHGEDSGLTLESESGLAISDRDSGKLSEFDSGITLESIDSGISLDASDSGISLDASDSGISLDAADSGISLESPGDSGISLDDSGSYALADDSGIEVGSPSDSGIALDAIDARGGKKKLDKTAPLMDSSSDDNLEATQMEMDSSTLKPRGKDAETSVILFDDESEPPAPPKSKGKGVNKIAESSIEDFDTLESQTFGIDDSYVEAVDFEDQDLEVVEDVLSDSSSDFDEIESLEEMDVFEGTDEDFEESFTAGESETEFTPSPATSGRIAMTTEAQWGVPTFIGLVISSICMVICAMLMFDLVRAMWSYKEPAAYSGVIIDLFKGMFGN